MVAKAQGAGGGADPGPKQDYGFMYGRSFEDPDGHHLGSDVDGCRGRDRGTFNRLKRACGGRIRSRDRENENPPAASGRRIGHPRPYFDAVLVSMLTT